MDWRNRLIIEVTRLCREALGSWSRTSQLCILAAVMSASVALLLWVTSV